MSYHGSLSGLNRNPYIWRRISTGVDVGSGYQYSKYSRPDWVYIVLIIKN